MSELYQKLTDCFTRLDTVIGIEYQRNSGSKKWRLNELEDQVSGLDIDTLLAIKSVYPESYKLTRVIKDKNEIIVIDIYKNNGESDEIASFRFFGQLNQRSQIFKEKLKQAIRYGDTINKLITYKIPTINEKEKLNTRKGEVVKNDQSKFIFHEKTDEKHKGSKSILERIRIKEANGLKLKQELHLEKEKYIRSKLPMIYNAFYVESPKTGGIKSLTITQVNQLLKNASENPMADEDIVSSVKMLDRLVDGIKYIQYGKVSLVRLRKLDREKDLAKIQMK